mmetsp:Transcript_41305/g.87874  ORF Transcript_41305/g.87874 Transcript_41305/m.87874 type:complete len:200 (+) Transcript_41305:336-935(+)
MSAGMRISLSAKSSPASMESIRQWKKRICRPLSDRKLSDDEEDRGAFRPALWLEEGLPSLPSLASSSAASPPAARQEAWGEAEAGSKRNSDVSSASMDTMAPASAPSPMPLTSPPRDECAATAPATAPATDPTRANTPRSAPFMTRWAAVSDSKRLAAPPATAPVPPGEHAVPSAPACPRALPQSSHSLAPRTLWYVQK